MRRGARAEGHCCHSYEYEYVRRTTDTENPDIKVK